MQKRQGAALRNNLRFGAGIVVFCFAAWLQGRWIDSWLHDWEASITGGVINSVIILGCLINWQDDPGRLGQWCRAIIKPFRQEPQ